MRPQGGVATRGQLIAEAGLSPRTIDTRARRGRLFTVHRGVYALSPVLGTHGARVAAVLACGAGAVLSHESAAELWGLPVVPPRLHHVTVPVGGGRRLAGVTRHRTRGFGPGDVVRVGGILVTTPARTLIDLAAASSTAAMRRLLREAQYARLIVPADLAAALDRHPGHRGVRALRRADPGLARRLPTESPLEDELLEVLLAGGLPLPEAQVELCGVSGTRYRVDFLFRDAGLAIEADGRSVHERAEAFESDRDRDTDLEATGVTTMRFTRKQVRAGVVVPRVAAALRHRAKARRDDGGGSG